MKYPKFLSKNSTVGVVALSAGVGDNLEGYDKSINHLKEEFNIVETSSVRNVGERPATGEVRAKELDELVNNEEVDLIMCASGGDFLYEILPYVNLDNIKNNPKWYMGASDPTSILYMITTKCDIATLYGFNAHSYDQDELSECQNISIQYMMGNIKKQNSYSMYESDKNLRVNNNFCLDKKVYWDSFNKEVDITGRIIGGCFECLRNLLGTEYDATTSFIEKYKDDGIIFYFDIFSTEATEFYLTMLQMKAAGWFKYLKGVVVGRVLFPTEYAMTYKEALTEAFDVPVIFNADIGHVYPKMTIINGSIAHIKCNNGKGSIEFEVN